MDVLARRSGRRGVAVIAAVSLVSTVFTVLAGPSAGAGASAPPDLVRVGPADPDSSLAIDANGGRVAYTALAGGGYQLYRYDDATGVRTLLTPGTDPGGAAGDTTAVAISGDGSTVAFASDAADLDATGAPPADGAVQAYLAHVTAGGATLTRLPLPGGDAADVGAVAISGDGSEVAYGYGAAVEVWQAGEALRTVDVTPAGGSAATVRRVTLSQDGSTLAAIVEDATGTGRLVVTGLGDATAATLPDAVELTSPAALTGDGTTVIAAPAAADHLLSWDWRAGTDATVVDRYGHTTASYPSISADGHFVADSWKFDDENGYRAQVDVGGGDYVSVTVDDSNYGTPTTGFDSDPVLAETRPQISADGLTVAFRSNAALAGQPGPAPAGRTVLYLAHLTDEQAPTLGGFRSDLAATGITQTSVTLRLPDADDDLAVVALTLTDNGAPVDGDLEAGQDFTVDGLAPGTEHVLAVVAHDQSGHASDPQSITAWTAQAVSPGGFASDQISALPSGASGLDIQVDDQAAAPAISADGRYVAYVGAPIASYDTDGNPLDAAGESLFDSATLAADDQLFLFDTVSGATTLVSHGAGGSAPADGASPRSPAISANGRYLAYVAAGTGLAPGPTDGGEHVYVYDRTTGTSTFVSTTDPVYPFGSALYLSDDGARLLALIKGSGYLSAHAVVLDWQSGTSWRVDGPDSSFVGFIGAAISGDGDTIALGGTNGDMPIVSIYDISTHSEIDSLLDAGAPVGFDTDGSVLRLTEQGFTAQVSAEWRAAQPGRLTYFGGPDLASVAGDGVHAAFADQDPDTFDEYVDVGAFPDGGLRRVGTGWAPTIDADGSAVAYVDYVSDDAGWHVAAFVARPGDTVAPSWPDAAALTAEDETTSSIHLRWPAATDDTGVASYALTQDGAALATVPGSATDYDVDGLAPGTSYAFAVVAKDALGNASPALRTTASTLGSDVTPGTDPLIAHAHASGRVSLSWDADAAASGGYRVLRDDGNGFVPVTDLPAGTTTFLDTGLLAATDYTYRVDALDDTGTASPWTTTASVTTPGIAITKATASPPLLGATGLAALGGAVDLHVTGDPGWQGEARIAYWTHADADSPPQPQTAHVALAEDPAHPGNYAGSWTVPEGTGQLTAVTGVLTDGDATHEATAAAAGFPVSVSGALSVTVDPAPSGALAGSELFIDGSGGSADIAVDAPGTYATALPAGAGYRIQLRSSTFALLASATRDVVAGITSTAELDPQFESSLVVTVAKGDGATGATTVTVTDAAGHQLASRHLPVGQASVTFPAFDAGTDVTVTSQIDDPGERVRATVTDQLTLVGGENDLALDHAALPTAIVSGRVTVLPDSLPVASAGVHADVLADGRTWTFDTTTDDEGRYELPLLAGTAAVTVSHAGDFDDIATLSIGAGATVGHDVVLDTHASLTVHVLPPDGRPATHVEVGVRAPFGAPVTQVIPDGQTETTFEGLRHGESYTLTVTVLSHTGNVLQRTYVQTVEIDSYDASVTVQEVELPSATLTGTVVTDDGSGVAAPAANAAVNIADSADGYYWSTTTDAQGHYSVRVLAGVALSVTTYYEYRRGWDPDPDTATLTLDEGTTVAHDITFRRATLTVHVTAPDPLAQGGVTVQLYNASGQQTQDIPDGQTDATFTGLWWGSPVSVNVHVQDTTKPVLLDYVATIRLGSGHDTVTIEEHPDQTGLTTGTVGTRSNGEPILHWNRSAGAGVTGCANGVATTSIAGELEKGDGDFGKWAYHTYLLGSSGSGSFAGAIPPQYPMHGLVNIATSVECPPEQVMTPTQGAAGTTVNALAAGLSSATGVTFGGVPGTNLGVFDGGGLQVDAPAGSGTVAVVAQTPSGPVPIGSFTYQQGAAARAPAGAAAPVAAPPARQANAVHASALTTSSLRSTLSANDILQYLYEHGQQLLSTASSIGNLKDAINVAIKSAHPTCQTALDFLKLTIGLALNPVIDALVEAITPIAEELVLTAFSATGPLLIVIFLLTPVIVKALIDKLADMLISAAIQAFLGYLGCGNPNALIDPAGTVLDTNGNPVAGATVTILRSDSADGPFTAVDPTQPGIEPTVNPEVTADDGFFHWDVRAGYYEIAATKPDCTAPGEPEQETAIGGPYPVPPPQVGLVVTMQCPDEAPPPVPVVDSLDVSHGPTAGGTEVQLAGSGFTPDATVSFGGTEAEVVFASPNALTATAPPGSGVVDVVVHGRGGDSALSEADRFTYADPPTVTALSRTSGPASGGTKVTVTGSGFTGALAVGFGGAPGTELTVVSDTELEVTTPRGSPGGVPVVVVTPAGASTGDAAGQFTYLDRQAVQLDVDAAPSSPVFGQDVTLTVRTTPAVPDATLTAAEAGTMLAGATTGRDGAAQLVVPGLHAGAHTITVSYAGDDQYLPATAQVTVTVGRAPTTLRIDPIGPPPPWHTLAEMLAYLRALAAYLLHPTVTVHLARSLDGAPIRGATVRISTRKGLVCAASTDASGSATCTVPFRMKLLVLRGKVRATYAGSADYESSRFGP